MRKTVCMVMAVTIALISSVTAFAAPETMADGTIFDAEYYAQNNPDIAAIYGTDKESLFQHYTMYGKAEGRQAYAGNEVTMTRYGVLLEPGDENYLRAGYLAAGFNYNLTPITENVYYTNEGGQWVEHREPLETPRVSDPAANFVRKDWSGDQRYQDIRNEVIELVAGSGAGTEMEDVESRVKYYSSNQQTYEEFSALLNNLSIDLVKEGIVNSCSLSNSYDSSDGILLDPYRPFERYAGIWINNNSLQSREIYDAHPETWAYFKGEITIPEPEPYDPELDGGAWGSGW